MLIEQTKSRTIGNSQEYDSSSIQPGDKDDGQRDTGKKTFEAMNLLQMVITPKVVDRVIETFEFKKPKENKEAENRTDTLCIPYVRGAYDPLRKQLGREGSM